jgi:hypothetical protein
MNGMHLRSKTRHRRFKPAPRARGENRRCMPRESKHDSSTTCRIKHELNCAENARLDSSARDPIAYEGSEWNLYEYAGGVPPNGMDPDGQQFVTETPRPAPTNNAGGCTVKLVRSAQTSGGEHIGILIDWDNSPVSTYVNGNRGNNCTSEPVVSLPPQETVVGTINNLTPAQCRCLAGSCSAWNSTPVDQRERDDIFRNSNWAAKCMLKRCGTGTSWSPVAPFGWGGNTGICKKWTWIDNGTRGKCSIKICTGGYQECPDGFDTPIAGPNS